MAGPRAAPQAEIEIGREGGTELYLPSLSHDAPKGKGPASRASVFYNPVMAFSRDLSLSVLSAECALKGRRLTVWDALAATGVRGMRMLKETPAVESLLASDANPESVEVIRANAELEGSGRMRVLEHNAKAPPGAETFDVVELDPYGTPQPFIQGALAALRPGGILAVTATDMAVLAGPERVACMKRYGAVSLKGYLCREAGLRILIGYIDGIAAQRGTGVAPLLSYVGGYYVRTFLRMMDRSPGRSNPAFGRSFQPGGTGSPVGTVPFVGYDGPPIAGPTTAGPLWMHRLQDGSFLQAVDPPPKAGAPKTTGSFLDAVRMEAIVDVLFYYETSDIAKALHLPEPPPRKHILERLREGGWIAERTHASPGGWRTNAPWGSVRGVLRGLSSQSNRSGIP